MMTLVQLLAADMAGVVDSCSTLETRAGGPVWNVPWP